MTGSRKEIEAARAARQARQTAAERYDDQRKDILALLRMLERELRMHAGAAAGNPESWERVRDLEHVRESLKNLWIFFLVDRHGRDFGEDVSGTKAARFVEDYLEKKRGM